VVSYSYRKVLEKSWNLSGHGKVIKSHAINLASEIHPQNLELLRKVSNKFLCMYYEEY